MAANSQAKTPPVTLIVGPETLLAERAIAAAVDAADGADDPAEVSDVPGAELSRGQLVELTSPSLFASNRVLVVRDVQNAAEPVGDALVEFAKSAEPGASAILVHPGTNKAKKLLTALRLAGVREVEAQKITRPDDQVEFVRSEVARAGGKINEAAARRLVEAVGSDLRALAAASAQLATDAPSGQITEDVVASYFDGHSEVKGWVVADRAIEGRTAPAIETLRWALDTGTDPVLVVGSLATSLRTLAKLSGAPRGVREADVARDLGVPPWKIRMLRAQLRGWSPDGLASAIRAVADADLEVKGAGSDPALALTKALVAIGAARA